MRAWPVRRPTHAPATAIRINATTPPTVIPEFPAPSRRRKNLNPSCCRSTGGMRAWPVRRPTHAPATAIKINATTPPHRHSGIPRPLAPPQKPKPLVLPVHRRHACLAGPPANTCSRNCHQNKRNNAPPPSFRNSPPPRAAAKTLTPRAAGPPAACVPGRSAGQHMLPQLPSK